jgi:hypothetical protein
MCAVQEDSDRNNTLLQGIKKLFGPLMDDLDCVRAIKEAMELQVEACM